MDITSVICLFYYAVEGEQVMVVVSLSHVRPRMAFSVISNVTNFFFKCSTLFFLFGFDFYIEIREGRNKIFRSSRKFEAYVEEMASGDTVSGADDVLK